MAVFGLALAGCGSSLPELPKERSMRLAQPVSSADIDPTHRDAAQLLKIQQLAESPHNSVAPSTDLAAPVIEAPSTPPPASKAPSVAKSAPPPPAKKVASARPEPVKVRDAKPEAGTVICQYPVFSCEIQE